ncbi:addiction module toxin, Txe/YoeB [Caballeronia pedi]|uniref:Putative mRNA interferase YoeB n=2 Tax=Caballeronia pedi TaxID=1777141 RepID=A0A158E1L8_9BURK|nr:Txe/YoeB family addiction module toxin [Caballeronia pedi]SAL00728.1 addiction module toxin, Txe/YoeB [Caballeronia pedi]
MMARGLLFSHLSWDEYHFWRGSDSKVFERLTRLINECCRNPFAGTGKPEPLKGRKMWSRRIDEKNRFVYEVSDADLFIVRCRGHYGDH